MTFKELKEALEELERLGGYLDSTANIATHERVTKCRKLFTNSQGHLFLDTRP
jgi:hypothetical protein